MLSQMRPTHNPSPPPQPGDAPRTGSSSSAEFSSRSLSPATLWMRGGQSELGKVEGSPLKREEKGRGERDPALWEQGGRGELVGRLGMLGAGSGGPHRQDDIGW